MPGSVPRWREVGVSRSEGQEAHCVPRWRKAGVSPEQVSVVSQGGFLAGVSPAERTSVRWASEVELRLGFCGPSFLVFAKARLGARWCELRLDKCHRFVDGPVASGVRGETPSVEAA